MTSAPRVSVLLATHDDVATVGQAVASVLRQTLPEHQLVVVDDASTDGTADLLRAVDDPRLAVLRNDERLGLAASLNRGLEACRARFVARLDADDVAHPERLARQLGAIEHSGLAVLGSAVLEIDEHGRPGELHRMPTGPAAVRWRALFGSPFFHPTTILDRELLDLHGLRYDPAYEQAQDYELWVRLLAVADGDNSDDALVLRRIHARQASKARRDGQRSFQREIALGEIGRVAPDLSLEERELAWLVGSGQPVPAPGTAAVAAYLALYEAFSRRHGDAGVRTVVARAVMRAALGAEGAERPRLLARAVGVDAALPLRGALDRAGRRRATAGARRAASTTLAALDGPAGSGRPVRVVVVSPEPTPYRSPLFDRVAARPEVELTVLYAAPTVAGRTWEVESHHRAVFLGGIRLPGLRRALRHDYPVSRDVFRALRDAAPDVVVAHGWSTFASQAAIVWSRRRSVPYLLLVSSHDAVARAAWRRAVRRPIVPPIVRGAWGAFALGTLSRESLVAHGLSVERVRLFANTVDVAAVGEQADQLSVRRHELRSALALSSEDVAVLSAGRLVAEKAHDTLIRAVAEAGDERLALVIAGEGPERDALRMLAEELGVRLSLPGDLVWEQLVEAYVAADVFALLSAWEPWGVVVNEAAACGKPLVLSDQVGAAPDLLRDGDNGVLVPAGDVAAAAAALRRLAASPAERSAFGARSREIVAAWGYEPSVESFVQAVLEAAGATTDHLDSAP